MDTTYRWIQGDELSLLDPIFEYYHWTKLNPFVSRALIAEQDGKLRGFLVVQLFPHLEPLWVTPVALGTGIADELAKQGIDYMIANTQGWQAMADTPHAEALCKQFGMVKVDAPVYRAVTPKE